VIILPQRQTALFAKQTADVDLFSDGRLRLGVGVGWNWVEYDGLEMSRHFRRRGKRQEQQIALIRKLWEQPVVDHEDSDHRIDRAGILPRPKRKIPIWLGGFSEAAFDRAARIGDRFLFSGRTQTEAIQVKARIAAKLLEFGRDADAFGFESIQRYSRGDNHWPGDIAAWREAGGSHISVVTMGATSLRWTVTSKPSSVGTTSTTRSVRAVRRRTPPNKSCEADPLGRSESPINCKGSSDTFFAWLNLAQRSDWVCPRGKSAYKLRKLANAFGDYRPVDVGSFFDSSGS
jgi:hypothetical protein